MVGIDYLQSVELKLGRAKEHLDSLWTIERQLASRECVPVAQADPDSGGEWIVLKLPAVDVGAALIVGDCLHNLRSALDHIVYGMAERYAPDRSDKERRRSMFPIAITRADFERQVEAGRLNGVPKKATAVVKRLQPKNTKDLLWALNELDNIDKHRALTVVAALAREETLERHVDELGRRYFEPSSAVVRHGARLYYRKRPTDDVPRIKATPFMAFEEPLVRDQQITLVLKQLHEHIRFRILPLFKPFLQ